MPPLSSNATAASLACIVTGVYLWRRYWHNPERPPLPPGPKKLPLVGNLFDLPKSEEWLTYQRWCREFNSDILHIDALGKSIIIVNSAEIASDLLEKRSASYSGRVHFTMCGDLMGWDRSVGMLGYGDEWRLKRRLIHSTFNATEALNLRPHEIIATHNLLRRLLNDPNDIMAHLHHWAGNIVIRITYGIEVLDHNDPYLASSDEAIRAMFASLTPGAYLVDIFPILKHVPKWLPGASFKRKAEVWKEQTDALFRDPFVETQRRMRDGDTTPSLTSSSLQRLGASNDRVKLNAIMEAAGSMYGAGTETVASAVASGILALLENPDILKKAQNQIDNVVGFDRLPTFEDEDQLPYITALAKECLRWRAIAPLGVPHVVERDDTYAGYHIPKHSIIIPNVWSMLHDESVYPDPHSFTPERFLDKNGRLDPSVLDPGHAAFGFGRRICPGRYMVLSSVWIALASLIAAFDIKKAVDSDGNTILLSHEYLAGLAMKPAPFICSIQPRSSAARDLIKTTATEGQI